MRSITAAGLAKIQETHGQQPITAIQVQWAKNASRSTYSDKTIPGVAQGRIVDLGSLDFVITFDEGSDTAEVQCKLNDTDGHLKTIIDTVDIHKRPVWIYQTFEGMDWADRIFLFRGEINSPIEWNEGDRTLAFRIVSKVEDGEVGFSIEEGQLPNPDSNLIGQPWPLKFGTTFNVPSLRVTSPLKGVLGTGLGFSDFTLPYRITAAEAIKCDQVYQNRRQVAQYELDSTDPTAEPAAGGIRMLASVGQQFDVSRGTLGTASGIGDGGFADADGVYTDDNSQRSSTPRGWSIVIPNRSGVQSAVYGAGTLGPNREGIRLDSVTYKRASPAYTTQTVFTIDPGCAIFRCETLANLRAMLTKQTQYEFSRIVIFGGEKFPQGTQLRLRLGNARVTGQFQGTTASPSNVFLITAREHPDLARIGVPTAASVQAIIDGRFQRGINAGCAHLLGGTGYSIIGYDSTGRPIVGGITGPVEPGTEAPGRQEILSPRKSLEFYNSVPKASFHWVKPGIEVEIESATDPIVYITNLLPETIHNVSAYRTFGAVKQLTLIPRSYYTTRTVDMGYYTTTEVVFTKPLSYYGEGWDEETVYITSTSSIGPNMVDIMIWLIETYTTLDYDTVSFNAVKTKLAIYYNNFPLLDRKNVLDVLSEIAFQNRCTIYLRDGKFYLKYLSELPSADGTITEDDIDANSLVMSHTTTEDLCTKLVASWKYDYSKEEDQNVVLRNNIEKYGTHEKSFEFYCFNVIEWVVKSATFWLIRKSNTYKKLSFTTALQHIRIEPNDCLEVNIPDLAAVAVPCRVEKALFNSAQERMEFEVWTPVMAGTKARYSYANPAYIPAGTRWPPDSEITDGTVGGGTTAPGFTVTAPSGHPLLGGSVLPSGYTFGPCDALGPETAPQAYQTCGNTSADTYPSDLDDSPITRDIIGETPPDTTIDPADVELDEGPVDYLGGLSPLDELEQKVNQALEQSQEAMGLANSANTAGGGGGSGNDPEEEENEEDGDQPLDNKPPEPPPEQECVTTVRIYMGKCLILRKTGEAAADQDTGYLGYAPIVDIQTVTFETCCEGKQLVKAIQDQHRARQDAESYNKGEVVPVNANVTCDSKPECQGWEWTPKCSDIVQYNETDGPPPIITPGASGSGSPNPTSHSSEPQDDADPADTGGKSWYNVLVFTGDACKEDENEPEEGDPGAEDGGSSDGLPTITPYNGCNGPSDNSPNSPATGA